MKLSVRTFFSVLFAFFLITGAYAQKRSIRYEAKDGRGVGSNVEFKIFSYGKDYRSMNAESTFKRDAVHAVIFSGVTNETRNIEPLYTKPQADWDAKEQDFWKRFFAIKRLDDWKKDKKRNPYPGYDTFVNSIGSPDPRDVTKIGKERRIGVPVKVNRELLRKHLQEAGIL